MHFQTASVMEYSEKTKVSDCVLSGLYATSHQGQTNQCIRDNWRIGVK